MLTKDKQVLSRIEKATQYEWLETNGLGGWSGSSIIGANTRRYHGLLVAATVPPAERMVLLSKLDETIILEGDRIELGTNLYNGNRVHPEGHQHLLQFTKGLFPQWEYDVQGIQLNKAIAMIHSSNTVVIRYEVIKSPAEFTLEFLPLVAARNYHSLNNAKPSLREAGTFKNGMLHCVPDGKTNLYISVPGSSYQHSAQWFYNFNYPVERYRGLPDTEDLLNPGKFSVQLKETESLVIIISTENPEGINAQDLLDKETHRRLSLLKDQPPDNNIRKLILAADQFIVERDILLPGFHGKRVKAASIIAGYHWFTDWGRDTMIALPGVCLSTGRFDDARKILSAFAAHVSQGMLPNRFMDNGEETEYNTVDATLWYFIAIYKYLGATNDRKFILEEILPVLKEIVDWHFKGTRYNIKVDDDGLLYSGEKGHQLTWMDAKIGDRVVTPRTGKPVEIQALWYNALIIFGELLKLNGQSPDAILVNISAEKAGRSFREKFWYADGRYLYDVIDQNGVPDASLRPNQLLAISLPFSLVSDQQATDIINIVEDKLYTPPGLRTLSPDDPSFVRDTGYDDRLRDAAYHQGTVWSWLLGPYVDALAKTGNQKDKIKNIISNISHHLNEGCIGTIGEIFDTDPPWHPRGCVAQAWGVGEILRVIKENLWINMKEK